MFPLSQSTYRMGLFHWIWLAHDSGEMQSVSVCAFVRVPTPSAQMKAALSLCGADQNYFWSKCCTNVSLSLEKLLCLHLDQRTGWHLSPTVTEGMLVHHLISLPCVKLTEPGVSPYFARKSWMYQLECYFFFFFFDWISTLWYSLWPLNLVSQLYFRDQLCNQQVKMHGNGKP